MKQKLYFYSRGPLDVHCNSKIKKIIYLVKELQKEDFESL